MGKFCGSPGGSWAVLGGIPGDVQQKVRKIKDVDDPTGILGGIWGVLGRPGCVLGSPGEILGRLDGILGLLVSVLSVL